MAASRKRGEMAKAQRLACGVMQSASHLAAYCNEMAEMKR